MKRAILVFGVLLASCGMAEAQGGYSYPPGMTLAQLNSLVQATVVTTGTGGTWSVTWSTPFPTAPVVAAIPVNAGTQPMICNPGVVSLTAASGTCWTTTTTGLTLAIVTSGITVNPTAVGSSGVSVEVIGRQATQ